MTVQGGAMERVLSGGKTVGDLVEGTGSTSGFEYVLSGGVASNATVTGPALLFVLAGGSASGTLVSGNTGTVATGSGGMIISSGGVASGTIVSSGGLVNVRLGGFEFGAVVHGGGRIGVGTNSSGGETFNDTLIGSGAGMSARETVSSGGYADATNVDNTGLLVVLSGGLVVGAILSGNDVGSPGSNGGLIVSSGGVAVGAWVNGGGLEDVRSGGTVSGAQLGGGTLEVESGGLVGSSSFAFLNGGTLKLDNSTAFPSSATIADFVSPTDHIDLADILYSTSTTLGYSGNTMSGTLTVSDGIHTAHLSLLGQYSAASFQLTSEGNGGTGTIVNDAPLTADASMVLQTTHS
jgi:autotransporter passenger strand-loop-strand repeat protein